MIKKEDYLAHSDRKPNLKPIEWGSEEHIKYVLPTVLHPHKTGKISRKQAVKAVKAVKKAMTALDRRKLNSDSTTRIDEE